MLKLSKILFNKEISDESGLNAEFVLNNEGRPPPDDNPISYKKFFNSYDINQGWIGNCFHIGAIVALMNNEDLLSTIIPPDNIIKSNMDIGAYHFRFWRLGHWYDVVVDDFLPVNSSNELIFSYNKTYRNEFWIPLFEKALAKFMGSYDELEGGIFENSALFLSGGLHDTYLIGDLLDSEYIKTEPYNDFMPSVKELLEIIRLALERKNMIGCIMENVISIEFNYCWIF